MKNLISVERDWASYMQQALELAKKAKDLGDVPVGAIVLNRDGKVIGRSFNQREKKQDPVAHAEISALQEASKSVGSWRLSGCTLVVTLEPCLMCAGASQLARVDRVVFGASEKKSGAMGSIFSVHNHESLNHTIEVVSGVLEEESSELIRGFFKDKRSKK